MLLKRIFAGVLCAVILAGAVYYGATFRFFDRPLSAQAQEEFQQSIALPAYFALAASADCSGENKNTLPAVRQAVKSGAHALELNIAFDGQDVPYLADGEAYITADSVPLETVFKTNAAQKSLRYLLNIRNFASPKKLADLLETYDLRQRVVLCGFTLDTIRANRSAYARFKLCVDLTESINLKNEDNCLSLLFKCTNAGAVFLRCTADKVTPELSEALKASTVSLIVDKVHTDYEMYYALSLNPRMVVTDRPSEMHTLLYTHEYLRQDMENPF